MTKWRMVIDRVLMVPASDGSYSASVRGVVEGTVDPSDSAIVISSGRTTVIDHVAVLVVDETPVRTGLTELILRPIEPDAIAVGGIIEHQP